MNHPVDRMNHPVDRITHPVDRMNHPVDRITHPVDRITHPVDRITHPVDRITHPVDRITHPVDRRYFLTVRGFNTSYILKERIIVKYLVTKSKKWHKECVPSLQKPTGRLISLFFLAF
jgi:hypothetical protein